MVELLKRFAEVFGVEVDVGDKKGKFFLSTEIPPNTEIQTTYNIEPRRDKNGKVITETREIIITMFTQPERLEGSNQAALVVAIDVGKYRAARESLK